MKEFKYSDKHSKRKFRIKLDDNFPLLYSFKYFDENVNSNKYYKKNSRQPEDFFNFMQGCYKISELTWRELKSNHQFHCHDINTGFEFSNEKIKDCQPMQIKLPGCKQGRLVGFIDNDLVFNVVKFDKEHLIYPDKHR